MNVKIDKESKTSIYLQIASQLKRKILSGELNRGSTLPSERAMASILGVHRNTVVKAYNELKAEELIESKQGIGYIVAVGGNNAGEVQDEIEHRDRTKNKRVNWVNQIKPGYLDMEITFDDLFQRFGAEDKYSLGSGISAAGIYDNEKVAQDIAEIITAEGRSQYFYSPYKGDKFLRQKLVSFLGTKGIKASTGQIQILTETNQVLDFLVMLLVKPGDTVIMEEPV